jgi:hypothetical protein
MAAILEPKAFNAALQSSPNVIDLTDAMARRAGARASRLVLAIDRAGAEFEARMERLRVAMQEGVGVDDAWDAVDAATQTCALLADEALRELGRLKRAAILAGARAE